MAVLNSLNLSSLLTFLWIATLQATRNDIKRPQNPLSKNN
jgi:hypothetical protein